MTVKLGHRLLFTSNTSRFLVILTLCVCGLITVCFRFSPLIYNKLVMKKRIPNRRCTFPDINPYDPVSKALLVKYRTLHCDGLPNLIYKTGNVLRINRTRARRLLRQKGQHLRYCRYKSLTKSVKSDFHVRLLHRSAKFNDSITLGDTDEYLMVDCYIEDNVSVSRSYHTVLRHRPDRETLLQKKMHEHRARHAPKETLSIFLLGIDGMSRQGFLRSMPLCRQYLLEQLEAIELRKYTKVGENTFPNVMPLLTGKSPEYFYRRGWRHHKPFDRINEAFLWSEYGRAGYLTALMMDMSVITAFHFAKQGWHKEPVDYYFRPIVLRSSEDQTVRSKMDNCVGDTPEITLFHDFWLQFFSLFSKTNTKPFFGYSFSARLTHNDPNRASAGDELYLKFLKEMVATGALNNTVLIFLSDHGQRFGTHSSTYIGVEEGRQPYMFFVFPPWFRKKYPDLMKVFEINRDRLTCPYDIYETMRDLLYFKSETRQRNVSQRGISLFSKIPEDRNCLEIGIPVRYCACKRVSPTQVSPKTTRLLAETLVEQIVFQTQGQRQKCAILKLNSVESVFLVELASSHGYASKRFNETLYKVTVSTTPGNASYTGILSFRKSGAISLVDRIGRVDVYDGLGDCMSPKLNKLRVFCLCLPT